MAACTDRAKELARIGELSVAQLKEECRSSGVKVSGTKKELADRLKAFSRSKAKTATKAAAAEQAGRQAATEKAASETAWAEKAAADKAAAERDAAELAAAEKAAASEAAAEKAAVAIEKAWAEKVAAEQAVAEKAAAELAAAEMAAASEAAAEKAAVAIEKAWAEKVAAEQAVEEKAAADLAAAETAAASEAAAEKAAVAIENAWAEKAAAEQAVAEQAAAEKAAASEAAAEKAAVAIENAWAEKVAAEQAAAVKAAAEFAAAEKAAAEVAAAEKAAAETSAAEKVDSCVGDAPSADFALTDPYTENKEETSESHKEKDRSRSPRLATALASLPTAGRRRCTAIRSGGAPAVCASTVERARSRSPMRKDALVADQPFATPSKFGCMYDRLKAKADAKERGDNVSTDWTPRASPLRANWQTPTRTPTSSLTASNAAFLEQASSAALGLVTAEFAELTSKPTFTAPEASPLGVPKMTYRQADLQADLAQLTRKPTPAPAPAASPSRSSYTAPAAFTPKRSSVAEGRMRMLEGLTEQMKICLARLQDKTLDDKKVEQYQELAKSIRKQMDQITSARTPGKSPGATMRSPAFGFSPASWRGC